MTKEGTISTVLYSQFISAIQKYNLLRNVGGWNLEFDWVIVANISKVMFSTFLTDLGQGM